MPALPVQSIKIRDYSKKLVAYRDEFRVHRPKGSGNFLGSINGGLLTRMKKKQIQPILYERIEQKNEIERELFAKMTPKEKRAAFRTWKAITDYVSKQGEISAADSKVKRK